MVITTLLALCLVAHADDKPKQAKGKVKYKELKAALDAQLTDLDKNKSGKLDHGEVGKGLRALRKTLDGMPEEADYDTDHDGKVERKEMKEVIDTNNDNKVNHGEGRQALLAFKQEHPSEWQELLTRVDDMRRRHKHKDKDKDKDNDGVKDRKERKERREDRKDDRKK